MQDISPSSEMFVAPFSYTQGNSMQTSRGGERKWPGRTDTDRAYPPSLEDETSLILCFGDQILDSIAFHLNCRGPDWDLFLFPARVILFHFASFDNNFLPFPTSNCILKCLLTRDTKPPPGSAILPASKRQWATCWKVWALPWLLGSSLPPPGPLSQSMAGPQSFSPASVVEIGSFSLFHPTLPKPAGHGAWSRHQAPNALHASAGGRDPWERPSAPVRERIMSVSPVSTFPRMTTMPSPAWPVWLSS